ncbi:MAG TPA: hypothetical protein VJ953_21945 [Saprospiraceae bacterium]|nr:hypothetical protein [Saprospiraceae bacterium]
MTRRCILWLLLCLPIYLSAQSNADLLFLPKGDTLSGEIVGFSFKSTLQQVQFEEAGHLTSYTLREIEGLQLRDGRYFSTQIRENELLEVLLEGAIDLYRDPEFYYLKKGITSILKLYEGRERVEVEGQFKMRTRQFWKGILIQSIYDCIDQPADFVRQFSLSEKDLLKALKSYHECRGLPYTEYGLRLPWTSISYGLTAGLVNSQLHAEALTQPFDFVLDRYQHYGIQAGVFMDLSMPRVLQNWFLHTELLYTYQHFYSDFEAVLDVGTEFREFNLNYQMLSAPITIQYEYDLRSIDLIFQFGLQFDFYLQADGKVIRERVFSDRVNTFIDEAPINLESTYYGYLLGIGAAKSIAGQRLGLGLRYTGWPRLSKEPELNFRGSRWSLNAIIYL